MTRPSDDDLSPFSDREQTEAAPPPRLLAGKYRLGRMIGEGGMGAVYEAEHTGLGVRVAVKLLNPSFAANEKAVSRFKREARAAAAVRHENIVNVTDTDLDEEGIPFIVMELLEGESLNAFLRRERIVTPPLAAEIIQQILAGLGAAHDKKVIHRDLKPGNVILMREPSGALRVKVLDFGISKFFTDEQHDVTATGAIIGTPRFMAPEQARGQTNLDVRVDIYAAGLILYLMVTGKLPFGGGTPDDVSRRILDGEFAPPRQARQDVSPELEAVILRAMATDRDKRFPDARSMIEALRAAVPQLQDTEVSGQTGTSNRRSTAAVPIHLGPGAASSSTLTASGSPQSQVRDVPTSARTMQHQSSRTRTSIRGVPRWWMLGLLLFLGVVGGAIALAVWPQGPKRALAPDGGLGATITGPELRFGITQYLPKDKVILAHQPFVDYLSRRLGRPVRLIVLEDYNDLADKLVEGAVDLAALSPNSYVRAKAKVPNLDLLATPVTEGGPTYQGVVLARADSSIRELKDFKGKVFCYINPKSTSGYLYPRELFRRAGIDPDRDLITRFSGDHVGALGALKEGACQGAAVFSAIMFSGKDFNISPEMFRIIATTDAIPNDAYVLRPGLPAALSATMRDAILAIERDSAIAEEVFKNHGQFRGFAAVDDHAYDQVRDLVLKDEVARDRRPPK